MPIRLRITLATTGLMIIALAALGTGMYITMSSSLENDMDNRLRRVYQSYLKNPGDWYAQGRVRILAPDFDPFTQTGAIIQITDGRGVVLDRSDNLDEETVPVTVSVLERNENFRT